MLGILTPNAFASESNDKELSDDDEQVFDDVLSSTASELPEIDAVFSEDIDDLISDTELQEFEVDESLEHLDKKDFFDLLKRLGMWQHLAWIYSNDRSFDGVNAARTDAEKLATTGVNRLYAFIIFVKDSGTDSVKAVDNTNFRDEVFILFDSILADLQKYLSSYVQQMTTLLTRKPDTIRGVLVDLKNCLCGWYLNSASALGRPSTVQAAASTAASVFETELKRTMRQIKRRNKNKKSHADLVRNHKMPAGGLKELRGHVLKAKAWLDGLMVDFVNKNNSYCVIPGIVSAEFTNKVLGFILAAMYCFCVQGR